MTRHEDHIQRAPGDIIIRLPGPPRGKGRPRFAGGRWVYTDAATAAYEKALGYAARMAWRGDPITGPVAVRVIASMPIPKSWPKAKQFDARTGQLPHTSKPDADNILKMLDALNGIVWIDDAQITFASVQKQYSATPELVVIVRQQGADT
jgi:Holliday junction resolvase RusA-like endonuclease